MSSRIHNSQRVSTYKKVQLVMALFILGLLLCGLILINFQREQLLYDAMEHSFETERSLLANLLTEPLLRSDYVQVRHTLAGFFTEYPDYHEITLLAPNGFEVFRFIRSEGEVLHQLQAQVEVGSEAHNRHTLILKKYVIGSTLQWAQNIWLVGLVVLIFLAVFGRLLWVMVRSFGLDPLSSEMELQQRSYQSIFDNCPDGILVRDCAGKLLMANEPFLHMLGYSAVDLQNNKVQFLNKCDACKNFDTVLAGKSMVFECEQDTNMGTTLPLEIHSVRISFGGTSAVLSTVRDISQRCEKEWHLRQLSLVVENNTEGMLVTDMSGKILAVNRAFTQISGYTEAEVLGENPRILQSGLHKSEFYRHMWTQLLKSGLWQGEIWNRNKGGNIYPEWLTIRRLEDEQGKFKSYVAVFSDLSAQKAQEEKFTYLAQTDLLTSLPNQMLFRDRLQQAVIRADGESGRNMLVVMAIGLDHFKKINESLGHNAGDQVVVEIARRLRECVQETGTLSRLRGDEFALLLPDAGDKHAIRIVAEQLLSAMREPLHVADVDLFMTGSIGIALYPQDTKEHGLLLQQADVAMHQAKDRGRDRFCFFSAEFSAEITEDLKLEALLHKALENRELLLYYQPQMDITTGEIVGAEALLRWNSAELGWVPPDRMIPVAENSGLIVVIGTWVLEQAVELIQRYHIRSGRWMRLAVNVSAVQFMQDDFADIVAGVVERYAIPPSCLELELTESLMLRDVEKAIVRMKVLRHLGVSLALDDFGTGYTSLAYLKRFPIDKIKLDRAFVTDIHKNLTDAALAQSLVAFTHVMGCKLVAEGVEEQIQAECLVRMGFKYAQGYLYAKPQPEDEFVALLEAAEDKA
ncbi:MAG: EAL domain-containing protein [Desulfuromonadaceae bacterium]|nr:EAL domain-containing protein [Desulfuromonas sp.]MDY0185109.1 EAL domain-containing protein [Desulfuromonadaceae bacterium]